MAQGEKSDLSSEKEKLETANRQKRHAEKHGPNRTILTGQEDRSANAEMPAEKDRPHLTTARQDLRR